MVSIEEIWARIVEHEGEEFRTKTELPFTYEVRGDVFFPSRTDYQISKLDFKKALKLIPFGGPGVVRDLKALQMLGILLRNPVVRAISPARMESVLSPDSRHGRT